ncbi:MAG: hypothetical protein A2544_01650 [Candidatus Zambryskibacteria bacterium RIFOXYD2_FULL_43_10]|uniref:ATP-dependent Clp protease proteolytic subunit n=1 Tax=Candidatus Zambryskibacteria bacterium RIFOXYD2_FULL_43_10 TaxID=1802782 RepID=A0A1G2V6M6_9BACT|nr:MAG: hypothetical protein A2544_01650 [Candidatus Zambryskibacteria bacterium RIFOXYD2_FULL_43_10]
MSLPIVLLSGELSSAIYQDVGRDILRINNEMFLSRYNLVMKSHGGDIVSALNFVDWVQSLGVKFSVKIYEAQSAAAFVAFSLADEIELHSFAEIGFHLGEIPVSINDIMPNGQLPQTMRENLSRYTNAMSNLMKKLGIDMDKFLMAELCGSGWLRLSAKECLKRGMVQRLF